PPGTDLHRKASAGDRCIRWPPTARSTARAPPPSLSFSSLELCRSETIFMRARSMATAQEGVLVARKSPFEFPPLVNAGQAGSETSEDLVGDRTAALRDLVHGDVLVPVRPDEGTDLTGAGLGDVREVHGSHVHRNAADDRDLTALDDHLTA